MKSVTRLPPVNQKSVFNYETSPTDSPEYEVARQASPTKPSGPVINIRVYRNGDEYHQGLDVPINRSQFRHWVSLLEYLTSKLEMTSAVHKLYTLNGTEVRHFRDLRSGTAYVASPNVFKAASYGKRSAPPTWDNDPYFKPNEFSALDSEESLRLYLKSNKFRPTLGDVWDDPDFDQKNSRRRRSISADDYRTRNPDQGYPDPEPDWNQGRRSLGAPPPLLALYNNQAYQNGPYNNNIPPIYVVQGGDGYFDVMNFRKVYREVETQWTPQDFEGVPDNRPRLMERNNKAQMETNNGYSNGFGAKRDTVFRNRPNRPLPPPVEKAINSFNRSNDKGRLNNGGLLDDSADNAMVTTAAANSRRPRFRNRKPTNDVLIGDANENNFGNNESRDETRGNKIQTASTTCTAASPLSHISVIIEGSAEPQTLIPGSIAEQMRPTHVARSLSVSGSHLAPPNSDPESDISEARPARASGGLEESGAFTKRASIAPAGPQPELVQNGVGTGSKMDPQRQSLFSELAPTNSQYSLVYFATVRNRAEVARLVLVYAGVSFDNKDVSSQDWPSIKPFMPFGEIPVLFLSATKWLSQSYAIARYLAREYGLAGNNNLESSRIDMLMDGMKDIYGSFTTKVVFTKPEEQAHAFAEFKTEKMELFLERYDSILEKAGTPYFIGNRISWADLGIAEYLATMRDYWAPDLLESYPNLKQLVEKVRSLPQLQRYYELRPDAALKV